MTLQAQLDPLANVPAHALQGSCRVRRDPQKWISLPG